MTSEPIETAAPASPSEKPVRNSPTVRARALRLLLVSVLAAIPVILCMVWLVSRGWNFFGPGIGAPLVPVLYFLTELITGVRFDELSSRWDQLQGWQRGFLGVGIVAIVGGMIVIVVGVVMAISVTRNRAAAIPQGEAPRTT